MARKVTPESFARLVEAARSSVPGLAVTTDVIAGFPGETDDEFAESMAFVRFMRFAGGHVFTFSPRPGTAAARYPDQVPSFIRKERNALLRAVLAESAEKYRRGFVGQTLSVLWESSGGLGPDGWKMEGLTDNYLRVFAKSQQRRWNEISQVEIKASSTGGLLGQISS
jgi:threonylcarbamoyladenosine tRNA methylthiotransferase MtaB